MFYGVLVYLRLFLVHVLTTLYIVNNFDTHLYIYIIQDNARSCQDSSKIIFPLAYHQLVRFDLLAILII